MNPSSTDSVHNSRYFSSGRTESKSSLAISTSSLSDAGGIKWTALAKRLLKKSNIKIFWILILPTGSAFLAPRARQSSRKSRLPVCWLCVLPREDHKAIALGRRGLSAPLIWSLPVGLDQTQNQAQTIYSLYPSSRKCTSPLFRRLGQMPFLNYTIWIGIIFRSIPIAFLMIKDFPEPGDPISRIFPLSFLLILEQIIEHRFSQVSFIEGLTVENWLMLINLFKRSFWKSLILNKLKRGLFLMFIFEE